MLPQIFEPSVEVTVMEPITKQSIDDIRYTRVPTREIWVNPDFLCLGEGEEVYLPNHENYSEEQVAELATLFDQIAIYNENEIPVHKLPVPIVLVRRENPINKIARYMLVSGLKMYAAARLRFERKGVTGYTWDMIEVAIRPGEPSDYELCMLALTTKSMESQPTFSEIIRLVIEAEVAYNEGRRNSDSKPLTKERVKSILEQGGKTENYFKKLERTMEALAENAYFKDRKLPLGAKAIAIAQALHDYPLLLNNVVKEVVEKDLSLSDTKRLIAASKQSLRLAPPKSDPTPAPQTQMDEMRLQWATQIELALAFIHKCGEFDTRDFGEIDPVFLNTIKRLRDIPEPEEEVVVFEDDDEDEDEN